MGQRSCDSPGTGGSISGASTNRPAIGAFATKPRKSSGPLVSTVYPVPPYPLDIIPYIDLGWLLVGAAVLAWMWRNRRDSVLATQMVLLDAPESVPAATAAVAETGPEASDGPPSTERPVTGT